MKKMKQELFFMSACVREMWHNKHNFIDYLFLLLSLQFHSILLLPHWEQYHCVVCKVPEAAKTNSGVMKYWKWNHLWHKAISKWYFFSFSHLLHKKGKRVWFTIMSTSGDLSSIPVANTNEVVSHYFCINLHIVTMKDLYWWVSDEPFFKCKYDYKWAAVQLEDFLF